MTITTADIIIVGGGPAGSACARQLKKQGLSVLILDKKRFPRPKVCAGWISPKVFNAFKISPEDYPHSLMRFNRINFYLLGVRLPVKTHQYSIRRYEFDEWMLSRSKAPVIPHLVKNIVKTPDTYLIDNQYECRYLVGAGGTHCPVYKQLFSQRYQRSEKTLIVALEKEYQINTPDLECHLWFLEHGLPGYSWYLPKANGWLNIGLGGKHLKLKAHGKTIMEHWHKFTYKLQTLSLIEKIPQNPKGHTYYLYNKRRTHQLGNAFIIGDAAGLSTIDMGEGIYAAVKSGLMAAEAIAEKKEFNPRSFPKFSLPDILFPKKQA